MFAHVKTCVWLICSVIPGPVLQGGMEKQFLAVGAGKQFNQKPGVQLDTSLDAPSAALMGEQILAVQNTL